jgi:CheY-like chemotaxis protein
MTIPAHPSPHSDDAHTTLLVVDDEPVIRELMAILLEDEGYAVRQAADGLAAWELLQLGGIDLVLSDVKMPRLDGASLARRLLANGSAVPIVLMSAVYAEVGLPGVRFLRKPVSGEQLLSTIAATLSLSGRAAPRGAFDDRENQAPFVG